MNRGAKIALGVGVVGLVAVAIVASESDANAAPSGAPPVKPPLPQPQPGSVPVPPSGGIVMVPPVPSPGDTDTGPGPSSPPPVVAPPSAGPIPLPGGGTFDPSTGIGPGSVALPGVSLDPNGNTITLPGIGTFDPATGNVFGPNGVIVGTFDPATKVFTPGPGLKVPLPAGGLPPLLPPVVNNGQPTAPPANPTQPPVIGPLPPLPPPQSLPDPLGGLPPMPNPTPGNPSQVTNVSADTLTTLAAMLAQEQSPKWRKIPEPTLVTWQKNRGLTGDGDFGTGTALRMADETGMLPIIRGWPKGSFLEGHWLEDYRAALRAKAATASEPRKSQLLAAAEREQGQGWGTPEHPITSLIHLQEA